MHLFGFATVAFFLLRSELWLSGYDAEILLYMSNGDATVHEG